MLKLCFQRKQCKIISLSLSYNVHVNYVVKAEILYFGTNYRAENYDNEKTRTSGF